MPLYEFQGDTMPISDSNFDMVTTKLDAINLCMRSIGVSGVDSVDSGDLDAEDASKIIDIVSQRFQYRNGKGWWFNCEPNWKIAPDSNGDVVLPNNTIAVQQCYAFGGRKVPMTMRGGRLYSTWMHTFDMRNYVGNDGMLNLTLAVYLPFEHLPISAMQAVAYQAAVEFITSKDADKTKLEVTMQIAQQLFVSLQSEDAMQTRRNMFIHNPTQRNFGAWAGGSNNLPSYGHAPYDSYPLRPDKEGGY